MPLSPVKMVCFSSGSSLSVFQLAIRGALLAALFCSFSIAFCCCFASFLASFLPCFFAFLLAAWCLPIDLRHLNGINKHLHAIFTRGFRIGHNKINATTDIPTKSNTFNVLFNVAQQSLPARCFQQQTPVCRCTRLRFAAHFKL